MVRLSRQPALCFAVGLSMLAGSFCLSNDVGIGYRLVNYVSGDMTPIDMLLSVSLPEWLKFMGWLSLGYGMGLFLCPKGRGACPGYIFWISVGIVMIFVLGICPIAFEGLRAVVVTYIFGSQITNFLSMLLVPCAMGVLGAMARPVHE